MNVKRQLSWLLSAAMVLTTFSVPVFAADTAEIAGFVEFIKDNVTVDESTNTVTLKNDITLDSQGIEIKKNVVEQVTIDLGGHTATVRGNFCAIYNYDADVTIKNGTIKMEMAESVTNTSAYAIYNDSGTMTIENLVVEGDRGALYNTTGAMTVNSGTFSAKQYQSVYNAGGGDITLNDGTYTSGIYNQAGVITINDGTYDANIANAKKGSAVIGQDEDGKDITKNYDLKINGGKFKKDPETAANVTIKDGYETTFENGYYVLTEAPPLPEVIATNYTTLESNRIEYRTQEEIVKALNSGVTVILKANLELTQNWTLGQDTYSTLDLNGYKITSDTYTITAYAGVIQNTAATASIVEAAVVAAGSPSLNGNIVFHNVQIAETCTKVYLNYVNVTTNTATFYKITGDYTKITLYESGQKFLKSNFGDIDDPTANINQIPVSSTTRKMIDTNDGYYTYVQMMAQNETTEEMYQTLDEAFQTTVNAPESVKIKLLAASSAITIPENANVELNADGKLSPSNSRSYITITNNGNLVMTSPIGSTSSSKVKNTTLTNNGICAIKTNIYADITNSGTLAIASGTIGQQNKTALTNNGICTITGGTMNSSLEGSGTYSISGGYFKTDVSEYLAQGCAISIGSTYTVLNPDNHNTRMTGTYKSAVKNEKYDQMNIFAATLSTLQDGKATYTITASDSISSEQEVDYGTYTEGEGDVIIGLIVSNIPKGVNVTVNLQ